MTPQYGTVNIVLEFVVEEITLSGIIYWVYCFIEGVDIKISRLVKL